MNYFKLLFECANVVNLILI